MINTAIETTNNNLESLDLSCFGRFVGVRIGVAILILLH